MLSITLSNQYYRWKLHWPKCRREWFEIYEENMWEVESDNVNEDVFERRLEAE